MLLVSYNRYIFWYFHYRIWHIRFENCWLHSSKCRILVLLRYMNIWTTILYKLLFSRGFYFREFREPLPSRKFPLQFMSIYSNDNIRKITKLTTHELPHLVQKRENNGLYSRWEGWSLEKKKKENIHTGPMDSFIDTQSTLTKVKFTFFISWIIIPKLKVLFEVLLLFILYCFLTPYELNFL